MSDDGKVIWLIPAKSLIEEFKTKWVAAFLDWSSFYTARCWYLTLLPLATVDYPGQ